MGIKFEDNRVKVEEAIRDGVIAFLYEAIGELQSQVMRNARVKTGQTKGSWEYTVDEEKLEAMVGSALENAIWEEFGTGEYALKGNGRKGGWFYVDEDGKGHFTYGKKPTRALHNAFVRLKPSIMAQLEKVLKGLG